MSTLARKAPNHKPKKKTEAHFWVDVSVHTAVRKLSEATGIPIGRIYEDAVKRHLAVRDAA